MRVDEREKAPTSLNLWYQFSDLSFRPTTVGSFRHVIGRDLLLSSVLLIILVGFRSGIVGFSKLHVRFLFPVSHLPFIGYLALDSGAAPCLLRWRSPAIVPLEVFELCETFCSRF